jgi:Tfp pilus assembly protein PilE
MKLNPFEKTAAAIDSRPLHFPRRSIQRRRVRSGMTLLEVGIALVVVTSAVVAVVELVSAAAQQRRASRERQVGLLEIANQAERIALLSWDEAAPDKLTTWSPSAILTDAIPTADCRIRVVDEDQTLPARRIELRLAWKNATGHEVEPALLTIWKFRAGGPP